MSGHIPTALSVHWCTPDDTCEDLVKVFGTIHLDPCSNPFSHVPAKTAWTLEDGHDGLVERWAGLNIFCNPPYGKGWWKPATTHVSGCMSSHIHPLINSACSCGRRREYIWPSDREKMSKAELKPYKMVTIGNWIERCYIAGLDGHNVIGLIPSYPDTVAWQKHVWKATRIFFPAGRYHFRLVYTMSDGSTVEKTGPAPMAVALPLWTNDLYVANDFDRVFKDKGKVVTP